MNIMNINVMQLASNVKHRTNRR